MADYEINVDTLNSKKSSLNNMVATTTSTTEAYDSTEIKEAKEGYNNVASKITNNMTRLKNGYNNSYNWFESYLSELESLESSLASFSSETLTTPIEFKGQFEDIFGKVTIPAIKTGGDKNYNKKLIETGPSLDKDLATGKSVEIPASVRQAGYTVTGYDYWIESGKKMVWASGTGQRAVSEIWQEQGSRFKDGIAVVTVNGEDRYLVALAGTFGKAGDAVDIHLENGQTIPAVIGDIKSSGDSNYNRYGHGRDNGTTNVLEWEVQRSVFKEKKSNPSTERWGLEWDSNSRVTRIDNGGSII